MNHPPRITVEELEELSATVPATVEVFVEVNSEGLAVYEIQEEATGMVVGEIGVLDGAE